MDLRLPTPQPRLPTRGASRHPEDGRPSSTLSAVPEGCSSRGSLRFCCSILARVRRRFKLTALPRAPRRWRPGSPITSGRWKRSQRCWT